MNETPTGRDVNPGRFLKDKIGGGRRLGVPAARRRKLCLDGQEVFLQKGIEFLPELMDILQKRVKEESCLTSAKLILERALPGNDAAGLVLNQKMAELEEELARCHGVLEEQNRTIVGLTAGRAA